MIKFFCCCFVRFLITLSKRINFYFILSVFFCCCCCLFLYCCWIRISNKCIINANTHLNTTLFCGLMLLWEPEFPANFAYFFHFSFIHVYRDYFWEKKKSSHRKMMEILCLCGMKFSGCILPAVRHLIHLKVLVYTMLILESHHRGQNALNYFKKGYWIIYLWQAIALFHFLSNIENIEVNRDKTLDTLMTLGEIVWSNA